MKITRTIKFYELSEAEYENNAHFNMEAEVEEFGEGYTIEDFYSDRAGVVLERIDEGVYCFEDDYYGDIEKRYVVVSYEQPLCPEVEVREDCIITSIDNVFIQIPVSFYDEFKFIEFDGMEVFNAEYDEEFDKSELECELIRALDDVYEDLPEECRNYFVNQMLPVIIAKAEEYLEAEKNRCDHGNPS